MTMTPESVGGVIYRLSDFILRYAITLAAISALSMALLEAFKAVCSLRDRFHKRWVRKWILDVEVPTDTLMRIGHPPLVVSDAFHDRVYLQLIQLTTGQRAAPEDMEKGVELMPWTISSKNALFALELEKMMGQIQDAADAALGYPHRYGELYLFLSAGADGRDIVDWYVWAQQPPTSTAVDSRRAKQQSDTYAQLRQFIRRRLDAFQLTTSYRWQTANQIASVLLGATLLFGSLVYLNQPPPPQKPPPFASGTVETPGGPHSQPPPDQKPLPLVVLVVLSLAGGIVAPVAKDLVIALKRVRSGG